MNSYILYTHSLYLTYMSNEPFYKYMWSNGEKPLRSYKQDKPCREKTNFINRTNEVSEYYVDNPYVSRDEHIHQINQQYKGMQHQPIEIQYALESTEKSVPSGKRDDMNVKLTERMPIASVSINPYLRQSNYIDDMNTRNNFLIPKNSNQESSSY